MDPRAKAFVVLCDVQKFVFVDNEKELTSAFQNDPVGLTVNNLRRWLKKLYGDTKVQDLLAHVNAGIAHFTVSIEGETINAFTLTLKKTRMEW